MRSKLRLRPYKKAARPRNCTPKSFCRLLEQNLDVARANYDVGKITFQTLAQAQRQLIDVQEKYQQTLADYHRRRADLERAVGGFLPQSAEELPGS